MEAPSRSAPAAPAQASFASKLPDARSARRSHGAQWRAISQPAAAEQIQIERQVAIYLPNQRQPLFKQRTRIIHLKTASARETPAWPLPPQSSHRSRRIAHIVLRQINSPLCKIHPHILPEVASCSAEQVASESRKLASSFRDSPRRTHTAPAAPPDSPIAAIPQAPHSSRRTGSPSDPGERPSADPQTAPWESSTRESSRSVPQTPDDARALRSRHRVRAPTIQAAPRPAPSNPPRLLNHLTRGSTHKSSESAAAMPGAETTTQHGSSRNATRPAACTTPGLRQRRRHLRNAITKPATRPSPREQIVLAALQQSFLFQSVFVRCMVAAVIRFASGHNRGLDFRCCDSLASQKRGSVRKGVHGR